MISTTLSHKSAILIIEMKIAGELLGGRFTNIATIALLLRLGQILNRHLSCLLSYVKAGLAVPIGVRTIAEGGAYHKQTEINGTNGCFNPPEHWEREGICTLPERFAELNQREGSGKAMIRSSF
jgi:hypothetical protein